MTNYKALYNQAMAHNAMLREALALQVEVISSHDVMERSIKALNATADDAEAWLKERDAKWSGNQYIAVELRSIAEKQLATVTAERDALRMYVSHRYHCPRALENYDFDDPGACNCGLSEALAQSPPSE